MYDYNTLRNTIISRLHTFTDLKVVRLNSSAPKKPDFPFFSYKFTTLFNPESGSPIKTGMAVPSSDPNFKYDYEYTQVTQDTCVISFSSHSMQSTEAEQLALRARSWFDFYGLDYLRDNGLVVESVGRVENRDTLLIADIEYKFGFDVTIRFLSKLTQRIETIEQVEAQVKIRQ